MLTPDHKRIARESLARAEAMMAELERDYPQVWAQLDTMRDDKGTIADWPDWCLLPMAAAVAITTTNPLAARDHTIAQMSAPYAWRHTRSVYLFEPALAERLLTQVPDAIGLQDLTGLPEWCVYIASDHPEFPGTGLWAHLEHDIKTGRPELRLLLDLGDHLLQIPIYLDRGSTVEALADYRATALATADRGPGQNVRGGELDASAALYAESIDGYLGLLAYLARPEADLVHGERRGARPIKPRRQRRKGDRDVWLVGYSAGGDNPR